MTGGRRRKNAGIAGIRLNSSELLNDDVELALIFVSQAIEEVMSELTDR